MPCLREHRAQLCETQRSEDGDEPCYDPRTQYERGRANGLGHDGGFEEDAGSNGDPDNQ